MRITGTFIVFEYLHSLVEMLYTSTSKGWALKYYDNYKSTIYP